MVVIAAFLMGCAAYAHWRLPIHTRHSGGTWLARALLVLAGVGLGYLFALWFGGGPYALRWAAFLAGFGAAHVPAAVILYIKRQRHEYG